VPVTRKRRISVEVLNVSLAVLLKQLVVKILPDVELAWRGHKPLLLLLLLGMIASMPLSQSCLFMLVHPSVVVGLVLVHMVVIVVVGGVGGVGGVVCEGLGISQHKLLPSHWL